jgi:hypothetical protein
MEILGKGEMQAFRFTRINKFIIFLSSHRHTTIVYFPSSAVRHLSSPNFNYALK